MKIELNKIKIRDLVEGYQNDEENGIVILKALRLKGVTCFNLFKRYS